MTDEELAKKAKGGDAAALNELADRFADLLKTKARGFAMATVPQPAVQAEAMRLLSLTAQRFDPKGGTAFKTFLITQLQALNRFVQSYRNIARIPEHRALEIGRFRTVKNLLFAHSGREPDTMELSDALGWHPHRVETMERSMRRDLSASGFSQTDTDFEANVRQHPRLKETMDFLYVEMTPEERLVFDYTMGAHGKPALDSVADIAKRTGLTPDRIYAIKRHIPELVKAVR